MVAEMDSAARLKIAVQKSGRLTENSLDLLVRCGLKYSRGKDQLMCYGENMPLDVLFVRDDDIPDLVAEDICDLGIVGYNVIEERRQALAARGEAAHFEEIQRLDFGRCRLALAVPQEYAYDGLATLAGRRIATTYPAVLAAFLRERGIEAEIVTLSGAVEIAPRLGTRGPGLRPGGDRHDAGRQPSARGGHRTGERSDADPHAGRSCLRKRPRGSAGCCCGSTASSRCGRASTSCSTPPARRCRRSSACCRAANRRR